MNLFINQNILNSISLYIQIKYILTSQSLIFISQSFPVKPIGHEHVNDPTLSLHVAPFKQGLELHSSTSMLHVLPININKYINYTK